MCEVPYQILCTTEKTCFQIIQSIQINQNVCKTSLIFERYEHSINMLEKQCIEQIDQYMFGQYYKSIHRTSAVLLDQKTKLSKLHVFLNLFVISNFSGFPSHSTEYQTSTKQQSRIFLLQKCQINHNTILVYLPMLSISHSKTTQF